MQKCLPHLKDYSFKQDEIATLTLKLKDLDTKQKTFAEYRKNKQELEYLERKKSSTFTNKDAKSKNSKDLNSFGSSFDKDE